MNKSKTNSDLPEKKVTEAEQGELFEKDLTELNELESDGSASAFDETESVNEDNFDNLSEK